MTGLVLMLTSENGTDFRRFGTFVARNMAARHAILAACHSFKAQEIGLKSVDAGNGRL